MNSLQNINPDMESTMKHLDHYADSYHIIHNKTCTNKSSNLSDCCRLNLDIILKEMKNLYGKVDINTVVHIINSLNKNLSIGCKKYKNNNTQLFDNLINICKKLCAINNIFFHVPQIITI